MFIRIKHKFGHLICSIFCFDELFIWFIPMEKALMQNIPNMIYMNVLTAKKK